MRNRRRLTLIAVVGLGLVAGFVKGEEGRADGNTLLQQCQAALAMAAPPAEGQSPEDAVMTMVRGSRCIGVLDGVSVTNKVFGEAYGVRLFCEPEGFLSFQAARLVVNYLKAHPEKLKIQEVVLVIAAMKDVFPCSGKP
jgi:hypothetical protein